MNPTWCMAFPDGHETGRYLALDMGGTNLRVCEVTLTEEKGEFEIIQSKYRMPEELKTGTADELWGYVADCLQQFVEYHHEDEELEELEEALRRAGIKRGAEVELEGEALEWQ